MISFRFFNDAYYIDKQNYKSLTIRDLQQVGRFAPHQGNCDLGEIVNELVEIQSEHQWLEQWKKKKTQKTVKGVSE